MDFTIANGLSMQGGDDIGDIQDSVDLINATAVFKAGTQTVTGDKTFNGDVIINNTNTTIQTTGTNTNTAIGGIIALVATDPLVTGLQGQITASAPTKIQFNITGSPSQLSLSSTGAQTTADTVTNVASTAFKVQAIAGTDKLNITPTTTTLTNPTTYILDGTGQGLQLTPALVELNATVANTLNLKVNSVAKLSATNVLTTNTNTTITDVATTRNFQVVAGTSIASITSGGLGVSSANISLTKNLSTDGAGIVTIRNGALNSGSPHVLVEKYTSGISFGSNTRYRNGAISASSISGGVETEVYIAGFSTTALDLTVPTITNVATTAFKVQSVAGTDKLSITPTLTQFSGNPLTLSVTGALNATASTFINIASTTSSAYSATTSLALIGGTSAQLTATTTNTISSSGAVSDAVQIEASSASGGIKMKINAVEKIFINSGVTTITNTYTDIVGYLYSQRYYIGTHSVSEPLSSCKFTGVVTLVPVGIGTSFINANMYGGTTATTVPFNFVPTKAIIYGDGGTITGGGAMTVRVIVNNFTTSTDTANTANFTLTSGIRSFAVMPFTTTGTLPISNEMIIKSGIVASAAITGATLTLQITIFGYQV
jgi:hypothetical protein